jgi:hypothetical protein
VYVIPHQRPAITRIRGGGRPSRQIGSHSIRLYPSPMLRQTAPLQRRKLRSGPSITIVSRSCQ